VLVVDVVLTEVIADVVLTEVIADVVLTEVIADVVLTEVIADVVLTEVIADVVLTEVPVLVLLLVLDPLFTEFRAEFIALFANVPSTLCAAVLDTLPDVVLVVVVVGGEVGFPISTRLQSRASSTVPSFTL
jgi:hypothetical protein